MEWSPSVQKTYLGSMRKITPIIRNSLKGENKRLGTVGQSIPRRPTNPMPARCLAPDDGDDGVFDGRAARSHVDDGGYTERH